MEIIKKPPEWLKGGIIATIIFLALYFVILPLLEAYSSTPAIKILLEIINGALLIIQIPILIIYSYTGFLVDAIYNTGIGYESLSIFPAGILFMKILAITYFFFLGALIGKICGIRKKKKKI